MIRGCNGGSLAIPSIDVEHNPLNIAACTGGFTRGSHPFCEPVRPGNYQTDFLLRALGLPHICTVPDTTGLFFTDTLKPNLIPHMALPADSSLDEKLSRSSYLADPNEISLDEETEERYEKKNQIDKNIKHNKSDPNEINLDI